MNAVALIFILIGFFLFCWYFAFVRTIICDDRCKSCGNKLPKDTNKPGYCDNDCYYDR